LFLCSFSPHSLHSLPKNESHLFSYTPRGPSPRSPTRRISASRPVSRTRNVSTSSGTNLLRERIPAPWRLKTSVRVSSEKTRPDVSVPSKRIGTCRETRPLLRTPLIVAAPGGPKEISEKGGKSFRKRLVPRY